ncbi:Cof-type HAD-IIB family hydrolase [Thiorhodococcus mannitoliphagus]|uniref:Cof-type HAD-IIB family hydrolase n=1 Tax=Thiorhodococcus mannitoliphagus TaxID=329406 RepID=A0A6P1DXZ8_9GAMM|nr:Cof-type HAD-IIB family hydrolase [Thiorhodococcus mannitoliphagus]NEX22350.1 Cof-type HAD-IIB family hydrolase [Thiorhodococcus mannitoliphagus]
MPKLIVSDLDGTLLNAEHRLGDDTRRVLLALRDQGFEVMLASGRHFQDIRCHAEILSPRGCLISSNGAAVHDRQGQLLHSHPVDADCLDFLLRDPLFDGVHTNVYRANDWLVDTAEPQLLEYHQESGFAYRILDFTEFDDEPVLKVFYYAREIDRLERLEDAIRDRLGDRVTTTYSLPVVLEVMAHGVSKGDALKRTLERLDIATEDVIAFGDGRNDIEMLQVAGTQVLMANAVPWLKAALPEAEIIGTNAEEAVAQYLLEHCLGGHPSRP